MFLIGGLQSARRYNGYFGRVRAIEDTPPYRLQLEVLGSDKVIRIRPQNLKQYVHEDLELSPDDLCALIFSVVENYTISSSNARPDMVGRMEFFAHVLQQLTTDATAGDCPTIECCSFDAAIARVDKEPTQITRWLQAAEFPCRGDGQVDLRRFGQGIANPHTEAWKHQVQRRLREFRISGLCEKCQVMMAFEEADWLASFAVTPRHHA